MARGQLGFVLHHLRKVLGTPPGDALSDAQLLLRFSTQRDQQAFATLVQRHGGMVLGVCRRVLQHEHDAEDAFQATFLVLARKAGSIRNRKALGAWLYEVAYHIALKARAAAARRRLHERQADQMPEQEVPAAVQRHELRCVLDEELHRLPERYRRLLVLCDLEGQTHGHVAVQVDLPIGSLWRHLARARELLRERLTQRGLDLTVVLLTVLLAEEAAAPVSAALVGPTVQAALWFTTGQAATAGASVQAIVLAKGVLNTMFLAKVKFAVAAVLLTCLAASVAGYAAHRAAAPEPGSPPHAKTPLNRYALDQNWRLDANSDSLPSGAMARLGTNHFRLGGRVESIAFTPDGRELFAAAGGGLPRLWEVATGKPLRTYSNPEHLTTGHLALSAQGDVLAAGGADGSIYLWEAFVGMMHPSRLVGHRQSVTALAFSPDGKILASAGEIDWPPRGQDNPIRLWDLTFERELRQLSGHKDTVQSLAFSPDGKTLASGGGRYDPTLRLWDAATGMEVRKLTGHGGELWSIGFSPDGKTIASGSMDKTIRLWDAATGQEKARLTGHRADVQAVAFAHEGKRLASGGFDRTLRLWDIEAGKELWQIEGNEGGFLSVAFSPDDKLIAAGGRDHTVRLWDTATGAEVRPIRNQFEAVSAVAFSTDSQTVLTVGGDPVIHLWDSATGKAIRTFGQHEGQVLATAISADGRMVATGGEDWTAHVWEVTTGREVQRLDTPDTVQSLAFSPDGRTLATGNRWVGSEVRLWELATGKLRQKIPLPHEKGNGVVSVAFAPDSRTLAAATYDGVIRFWDPATGNECQAMLHNGDNVQRLAYSPDGRVLAVGNLSGTIRLWESATGRERLRCKGWPFAFSPDGRQLATGRDTAISVWDVMAQEDVGQFVGHHGKISALAFSSDGRRLVSGSQDTTGLVWELKGIHQKPPAEEEMPTGQIEQFWKDLAGEDAAAAYQAIRRLVQAPRETVPFLAGKLHPVPQADERLVARLLSDLDSEQFEVRERAGRQLEQLGETAEPLLRKKLAGDLEAGVRHEVERLLEKMQSWSPDQRRVLRALEALERLGTSEASEVIAKLARESAGTRTGTEARRTLDRLDRLRVSEER